MRAWCRWTSWPKAAWSPAAAASTSGRSTSSRGRLSEDCTAPTRDWTGRRGEMSTPDAGAPTSTGAASPHPGPRSFLNSPPQRLPLFRREDLRDLRLEGDTLGEGLLVGLREIDLDLLDGALVWRIAEELEVERSPELTNPRGRG